MSYQQNIVGGYFLIGAACIAEASNMSMLILLFCPFEMLFESLCLHRTSCNAVTASWL